MDTRFLSRAIGAGFLATLIMTLLAYAAPLVGLPAMDFAAMLGSLLTPAPEVAAGSGAWWMGMIWHFLNGTIIFPLIYAWAVYPALGGQPWFRGMVWGVTLWLLSQLFVSPLLGFGVFATATPRPLAFVLASLVVHIIYGAVLGEVTGHKTRAAARPVERPRAA
jgi:hypothetical protein